MDILRESVKELIAVPSVSDNTKALETALDFVKRFVRTRSPEVTIEDFASSGSRSFLAYYGIRRPHKFSVILNGHVDVVAAKPAQFLPRIVGDRLYGRGAADMKASLLAQADVFCKHAGKSIALQVVSDEETNGAHGTGYQLAQGVQCDLAIVGESTPEHAICVASRGFCRATIVFSGTSAHSAYPWLGDNALIHAQLFVQNLLKTYPLPKTEAWGTTVNIANIATDNTAFNRIPTTASAQVEIRFAADNEHFSSRAKAYNLLKKLAGTHGSVALHALEPGHQSDQHDPLLQQLADTITTRTNHTVSFIKKHGAADVRYFTARNMNAVTFGAAGQGIHGDNEFVSLSALSSYHAILDQFLRKLR